jgi:hypothetical protein
VMASVREARADESGSARRSRIRRDAEQPPRGYVPAR